MNTFTTFIIRPLRDDDMIAMAVLHAKAIRHSYPAVYPAHVVDDWANSRRPEKYLTARERGEEFLVAEADGHTVGFIGWKNGELCGMYIDPRYHGKAIGTELVKAADEIAQANGTPITHVTAALSARGFYEKMGFKLVREGTSTVSGHEINDYYMER